METQPPRPEDVKGLERRLSTWAPSAEGLDADALLFAAGRASARPGPLRYVWPALTAGLTGLSIVLALELVVEHSERLSLARQLRQQSPAPAAAPSPLSDNDSAESPNDQEVAPDSYFASHRALEKGLDAWPLQAIVHGGSSAVAPSRSAIFRAGRRDLLLDP
jgi:hypothetical protein